MDYNFLSLFHCFISLLQIIRYFLNQFCFKHFDYLLFIKVMIDAMLTVSRENVTNWYIKIQNKFSWLYHDYGSSWPAIQVTFNSSCVTCVFLKKKSPLRRWVVLQLICTRRCLHINLLTSVSTMQFYGFMHTTFSKFHNQ